MALVSTSRWPTWTGSISSGCCVRGGHSRREEAFDIAIRVADALEAIHDEGIVHRDLKTPNIMRDSRGVVRVMDFGIAKEQNAGSAADLTGTGNVIGTPEYISPEQWNGSKADVQSDIYALGIIVYELFTAQMPFQADGWLALRQLHLHEPPPLEGERALVLPEPLRPVLKRALAKERGARFASAAEMADALRQARAASVRSGVVAPVLGRVIPVARPPAGSALPQPHEIPEAEPMYTPVPTVAPTEVPTARVRGAASTPDDPGASRQTPADSWSAVLPMDAEPSDAAGPQAARTELTADAKPSTGTPRRESRLRVTAGVAIVAAVGLAFTLILLVEPPPAAPSYLLSPWPGEPGRASPHPFSSREAAHSERRIEAVGPEMAVAFTNRGARLISWRFLHVKDSKGRPEEMVPAGPEGAYPLDVETGDVDTDRRLREGLYRSSTESLNLSSSGQAELVFRFSDDVVATEKRFEFQSIPGVVGLTVSVTRQGRELSKKIVWGPGLGGPSCSRKEAGLTASEDSDYGPASLIASIGGRGVRVPVAELNRTTTARQMQDVHWIGIESRRFAALLLSPEGLRQAEARVATVPLTGANWLCAEPVASMDVGNTTGPLVLYVGLKQSEKPWWRFW